MKSPHVSVVIPVYKSAESLMELAARLTSSLENIIHDFEIILVDDGSPDDSWEVISEIVTKNPRFIGLRLSRNFGQHPAITAGLSHSHGKWIVVMDCDLQDQPEEIPRLLIKAEEGYDQVVAVRAIRQDSLVKRFFSWLFSRLLTWLSGQTLNHRVGNFGVYSRKVIDAILAMPEQTRMFTLMTNWVGFRRCEIEVIHAPRPYGETSYSVRRLLSLALSSILSHSDRPLKLTVLCGFAISTASLSYAIIMVVQNLVWGITVIGWTSLMVAITLSTGLLMATIGIVGLYVGRIFQETKSRPVFILDKVIPFEET